MNADDIYQAVTDRMVQALERGVVPWQTPWTNAGRPRSMSTGHIYRGVNTWLLSLASQEHGWRSPWFGTYAQILERGGQVRKGERSTPVTFWKTLHKDELDVVTGEVTTRSVPMLRQFRVFNADQADNLSERYHAKPADDRPISGPQAVLDGYLGLPGAPRLHHDVAGRAYYDPARDEIHVPPISGYRSAEHYYATAFHEAAHSTGHASRLSRSGVTDTGATVRQPRVRPGRTRRPDGGQHAVRRDRDRHRRDLRELRRLRRLLVAADQGRPADGRRRCGRGAEGDGPDRRAEPGRRLAKEISSVEPDRRELEAG